MREKRLEKMVLDTARVNRLHAFGGELSIVGIILISTGMILIEIGRQFEGMIWFAVGLLFIFIAVGFTYKAKTLMQKVMYEKEAGE